MSYPDRTTALIIGGGIGGLATAVALRQVGIEATVCERASALQEVGAGIALWPNATAALARLGVLDAVRETAGPVEGVTIRSTDGRTLTRFSAAGYATPGLCIHRSELLGLLRGALPDAAIVLGHAYIGHSDDGRRVTARFTNETERTADLLVGADGLRSRVRTSVQRDEAPSFRGQTVVRGVAPRLTAPGEAFETWGDGLRFGLFDVGQERAYWYAAESATAAPRRATVDRAALLDRFRTWHDLICALIEATPESDLTRYGVHDRAPRRGWSRGRTVVMGDAAHPMTPDMGQGGAMAVEDALALADNLAEARDIAEALRRFERARYRRTARIVRQSRVAGQIGQMTGLRGRARDAWVRVAPQVAFERGFTWPFGSTSA